MVIYVIIQYNFIEGKILSKVILSNDASFSKHIKRAIHSKRHYWRSFKNISPPSCTYLQVPALPTCRNCFSGTHQMVCYLPSGKNHVDGLYRIVISRPWPWHAVKKVKMVTGMLQLKRPPFFFVYVQCLKIKQSFNYSAIAPPCPADAPHLTI